jgi:nitroreductase
MSFHKLIANRFSVRSYKNEPIPEETLIKIVEAGRIAPSAVNYQPWHFVIVNDGSTKIALQKVYSREWFKQAPAYIVVCTDYKSAWVRNTDQKNFADVDASIAAEHIILQATELGLGTCWVCNFDVEKCKMALNLPDSIEPLVIIPVGFSDEKPKIKTRKSQKEIVHWNHF